MKLLGFFKEFFFFFAKFRFIHQTKIYQLEKGFIFFVLSYYINYQLFLKLYKIRDILDLSNYFGYFHFMEYIYIYIYMKS